MGVKRTIAAVFLLLAAAQAQFVGYVGQQTTVSTAFTAQAANGVSGKFNNIGQAAHFLAYCPTNFDGTISLEASTDGTFAAPITLSSANYTAPAATQCRILVAGGYYPAVQARISNYVSGSINAQYTGIATAVTPIPTATNSSGQNSPVQCDQTAAFNVATGSNGNSGLLGTSTSRLYICEATFSFNAATTAGSVSLTAGGSCPGGTGVDSFFVTASTPQVVQLTFPPGRGATLAPGAAEFCVVTGAITATVGVSISFTFF